jgi:hypothetical protein
MAYVRDDNGNRYDIPDNEPTNLELAALHSFAKHQAKDKATFLPLSVLASKVDRIALGRLTRKGWLDRHSTITNLVRINPAGWWLDSTFEAD